MNSVFVDYFCCPTELSDFNVSGELSRESGFFEFGEGVTCYGRCTGGSPSPWVTSQLRDALCDVRNGHSPLDLPFDLTEVVNNLRNERYMRDMAGPNDRLTEKTATKNAYYFLRPLLPVAVRKHLQRVHLRGWRDIPFPQWPVDFTVDRLMERVMQLTMKSHKAQSIPFIWFWPAGAPACAIMTHDVEHEAGLEFCGELMNLDDRFAIKSAFQIVPEMRYKRGDGVLNAFRARDFEINVHDLNHDGFLFRDREEWLRRVPRINQYAQEFAATGFRAGAMYRNQDWYGELDFSFDMSVPNVAHLEPQRGGCCTVMPYFIGKTLELPLTTIQDYSLLQILGDYSIDLWKKQIHQIMQRNGLISFITHPDYLVEKRAQRVYIELLAHLSRLRNDKKLWIALPRQVDRWWRSRQQMRLVADGDQWRIEGPDSENARIAYATVDRDGIRYSFDSHPSADPGQISQG